MSDSNDTLNVLITVNFDEACIQRFRDVAPHLNIFHRRRNYTDITAEVWAKADILYTGAIFPAESMPNLKWLQSHFAGVDYVLAQESINDNPEIVITTTRGIHATNMAEYVLGMILTLGHRVPQMMTAQRERDWAEDSHDLYVPLELRKATVGIVGYGAVGREVARLVKVFGGKVLAVKRDAKRGEADENYYVLEGTGDMQGEMFDRLYPPQAVTTMVRDCDFVVITLPLTPQTEGMVDERVIKAMKEGSYLINVGRGGIVDELALLDALEAGHFAGAALDVFETEPLPEDDPLWTAPNLIITPHLSGLTTDYLEKAAAVFEENLRRYVNEEPLMGLVNREAGY